MLYRKVVSLCSENRKRHQVGKMYDFSALERVAHRPIITTAEEVNFRDVFSFIFAFTEENNSRFHRVRFKSYILASDAYSFAIPKY